METEAFTCADGRAVVEHWRTWTTTGVSWRGR
jgi:hypothetical protein